MPESMWNAEVDQTTGREWSELLDQFDDANIYQTAAYGAIRWGGKNLSRLVLRRNDEVVAIAQFRIIRPTPLKFGMAYLRWGPLWERRGVTFDPEVPLRMALAIEDEYLRKRKLFVRIQPSAFAGTTRAQVLQSAFSIFKAETRDKNEIYRTLVIDLSPSLEDLRRQLDKKWRNQLVRAEKNDLKIISGDGIEEFKCFLDIYLQMYRRKAFRTTIDIEEFRRMQEVLPDSQRMRVLICEEKGQPVSGVVASAMGNSAIYLLGATSDAGLNAKGAYLLQWSLINWLKERGIRHYDLGGIDPESNPGVYHFKSGLSGLDICQIRPLVASASILSAAMVRAGFALQSLRESCGSMNPVHFSKQPAEGS